MLNHGWTTILNKKYSDNSLNYTWSSYKADFDEAFRQLEEANIVLDEGTKVYHILNGIQCSYLSETVNQVRQTLATNYAQASIYLANAVITVTATQNLLRNNRSPRGIAKVRTGRYSDEDWAALNASERTEVHRRRNEKNQGRGERGESGNLQLDRGNHNGGRGQHYHQAGRSSGRGRGV